ncbi:AAA family ATPase [Cupriavidus campinensis]|uniref:AAA family ATPase n=1 Tax=Cupriavidus campinensis TaxID=151783 RepID=A0ABY3ESU4_9BURK|nr:AAA family ATPase [Cupriavidus campinensis]TSP14017.1 AAA family ATPase [Cupriavidus campinensis]
MLIGLAGSHRTGKTTLAKAFAEKQGGAFLETSVSAIFRDLGYDPAAVFDFATRLHIQEEVLTRIEKLYASAPFGSLVVCDRSPVDMAAYTTAEAVGDSVPASLQERYRAYIERCFEVTNRRFSAIVVVQPGIPVVHEAGKAVSNPAYMEHMNTLCLGLLNDERLKSAHFFVPRSIVSLDDRLEALEGAIGRLREMAGQMLGRQTVTGVAPSRLIH